MITERGSVQTERHSVKTETTSVKTPWLSVKTETHPVKTGMNSVQTELLSVTTKTPSVKTEMISGVTKVPDFPSKPQKESSLEPEVSDFPVFGRKPMSFAQNPFFPLEMIKPVRIRSLPEDFTFQSAGIE